MSSLKDMTTNIAILEISGIVLGNDKLIEDVIFAHYT